MILNHGRETMMCVVLPEDNSLYWEAVEDKSTELAASLRIDWLLDKVDASTQVKIWAALEAQAEIEVDQDIADDQWERLNS